jgi:hypothetical protein
MVHSCPTLQRERSAAGAKRGRSHGAAALSAREIVYTWHLDREHGRLPPLGAGTCGLSHRSHLRHSKRRSTTAGEWRNEPSHPRVKERAAAPGMQRGAWPRTPKQYDIRTAQRPGHALAGVPTPTQRVAALFVSQQRGPRKAQKRKPAQASQPFSPGQATARPGQVQ